MGKGQQPDIGSNQDSFKPRSTAVITRYLYRMYGQEGLDTAQILERSGIDPKQLADPVARIPHEKLIKMWEVAGELSGDPHFGLHLAEKVPVIPFNAGDYAAMTSKNLRESLYNLSRYIRISSDAVKIDIQFDSDLTHVFADLSGGAKPNKHHTDFWVLYLVRYIKGLLGLSVPLASVGFNHEEPDDTSVYQSVFNSKIKFNERNSYICYESKYLDATSVCADLSIHKLHESMALKELQALNDVGILPRVKRAISDALPAKVVDINAVASALNVAPRTVQRQLANEGVTFKKLVDMARKEYAISEMENTSLSISEVAYRLGYQDMGSIYRAFKRWTGMTPVEYRENLRSGE